jgi:hypothetical protein
MRLRLVHNRGEVDGCWKDIADFRIARGGPYEATLNGLIHSQFRLIDINNATGMYASSLASHPDPVPRSKKFPPTRLRSLPKTLALLVSFSLYINY